MPKPAPLKLRDSGSRNPIRQAEIERKVDEGVWRDDWSGRARNQTVESMAERKGPNCKPRPTDSRKNRGPGGSPHDEEMKHRFVPWCDRKS